MSNLPHRRRKGREPVGDPRLELFRNTALVGSNDDWACDAEPATATKRVGPFELINSTPRDAATTGPFASGSNLVRAAAAGDRGGSVRGSPRFRSPADRATRRRRSR